MTGFNNFEIFIINILFSVILLVIIPNFTEFT